MALVKIRCISIPGINYQNEIYTLIHILDINMETSKVFLRLVTIINQKKIISSQNSER